MDWSGMFDQIDKAGNDASSMYWKQDEAARANAALAQMLNAAGQEPAPPQLSQGEQDLGFSPPEQTQDPAQLMRNMGQRGLQGAQQFGGDVPLNVSAPIMGKMFDLLNKPNEEAMKQVERRQTNQENIAARSQSALDLQAAKASDRQELELKKRNALNLIDEMEAKGTLTPERAQQAREEAIGLQPRAKNPPNDIEKFEMITGADPAMRGTPEYQKAYMTFMQQLQPKQFNWAPQRELQPKNKQIISDATGSYIIDDNGKATRIEGVGPKAAPKADNMFGFGKGPAANPTPQPAQPSTPGAARVTGTIQQPTAQVSRDAAIAELKRRGLMK